MLFVCKYLDSYHFTYKNVDDCRRACEFPHNLINFHINDALYIIPHSLFLNSYFLIRILTV